MNSGIEPGRHLFVTDMDGTLLGSDSRVSGESSDIISALSREGVPVTVATARTPASVEVLMEATRTDIPAIVMTGAALWDRSSKRYVDPVYPSLGAVADALALFAAKGLCPFVYVLGEDGELDVFHREEMNAFERGFYEERRSLVLKRFIFEKDDICFVPREGTILVFAMGIAGLVEEVAGVLRLDPRLSVSCYRDIFNKDIAFLELFASGVSKAAAVRRLSTRIGAERVTVYGDNLNDIPMFGVANDAVAVSNALPEVKEAAARVIGPNTDSSVARDMMKCFEVDRAAFIGE